MPSSFRSRAAFSLVEVMIAAVVLAGCAMALVGFHANLQQARASATSVNKVLAIGRTIINQVVGYDSSRLGDSATIPWSIARYDETDTGPIAGNNPPLTDSATVATNNIVGSKLLQDVSGVQGLRIYIEYYKGAKNTTLGVGGGGTSGVLDDSNFSDLHITPEEFRTRFRNLSIRSQYRLDPTTPPARQLSADDVFLIRVVLRWEDSRMVELMTGKRVEAE